MPGLFTAHRVRALPARTHFQINLHGVTGQKSRETSDVRCAMAVGPADPVAYWSGRGRFPPDRTSQGRNLTGRGGERSLPGVTKEILTLVRRIFFDEAA